MGSEEHAALIVSHRAFLLRMLSLFISFTAVLLGEPFGHAHAAAPTPPLHLPASIFPTGSHLSGEQMSDAAADQLIPLHALSWSTLGRTGGYGETGQWMAQARNHRNLHQVTLHYSLSLFGTAVDASTALADAQSSLWETGHPLAGATGQQAFQIVERDGHVDDVVALGTGSVEVELQLRYGPGLSQRGTQAALRTLSRAAVAAGRIAASVPLPAQALAPSAPVSPLVPSITPAPSGTGPVVKSPSLMAVPGTLPGGVSLGPGGFRPTGEGKLALRATGHADLAPAGALSRFAVLPQVQNRGWYISVGLFPSADAAGVALAELAAANAGLQPASLPAGLPAPHLTSGLLRLWQSGDILVGAAAIESVVITFAAPREDVTALTQALETVAGQVPTPLHAAGVSIVDAAGIPVKLECLNWYGAEESDFVVGGLDYRPYSAILGTIRSLGYNCVRIPFSNQLVEQNPIVTQHVAADPELQGLHALDIMDRVIQYAGALGLSVVLDDHRSDAGWSAEPLWYTPAYPDSTWVQDWTTMAARYASSDVVVGADLRNEPHGAATWGTNDPTTDWRLAAQRGGDAVLAANPHLLVMVEGVQVVGSAPSYWWGGNLMGVATAPVQLSFANGSDAHAQLVYSPHDYGPQMCGAGCPWFGPTTTTASLQATWEQYWGYITSNASAPYAAPLWIGEFGTCNGQTSCVSDTSPGSQGQWFSSLVQYLAAKGIGWSYWAVNGTQSTAPQRTYGAQDWFGMLGTDWSTPSPVLVPAVAPIQGHSRQVPGS